MIRWQGSGRPAVSAVVIALTWATAAVASAAGTVNRVSSAEPNSLDPHVATGNTAASILYDMFIGLTTLDAAGRLIPGAAESWVMAKDGLTYTFKLRPGLKWSDGSSLTSADFLYSVRRAVTPATASRFASFFYPVKNARRALKGEVPPEQIGVEAPDATTLIYRLEYPAPYFLQNLSSNVASPVPRRQIETLGRQWTRAQNMVSNGPFRLTEWIPNDHVTLVKNPYFFDAANVQLDTVRWYPTENQATSLKRYQAGELDILLNFPNDRLPDLRREMPDEVKIWPGTLLSYLLLNNNDPAFRDVRVRKALSMALDREGIVQKFVTPGTPLTHVLTPPTLPGYKAALPEYAKKSRDERLAQARKLMREAGYGPEKPLAFDLVYTTLEENRRMAVAMAAMWQPMGVKASPLNRDLISINKSARTRDFQALIYTWYPPNDDPYSFLGIVETGNPANYSGYSNAAYDAMLVQANATVDPARRLTLLSQAEAVVLADQPVIPVFFYVRRFLVKPYITGFEENIRGLNLSRWLATTRKPGRSER